MLFSEIAKQLGVTSSTLQQDCQRSKVLKRLEYFDFDLSSHIYIKSCHKKRIGSYYIRNRKFINRPELFMERWYKLKAFRRPVKRPKFKNGYKNPVIEPKISQFEYFKFELPVKREPKEFFNENYRDNIWKKYGIGKI